MAPPEPAAYADLARYPIDRPGSAGCAALLARVQAALEADGCAVLKGFVRPAGMAELVAEADRVSPAEHRSYNRTNAYFTQDDPDLPVDHPKQRFYDRSNAFVPADNFGAESILRAIYEWPAFAPFIQAALREARFYAYADPLADVIVNVVEDGGGFPWHFDTNNYTVTLAIQNGEAGGLFEYVPALCSAADENYRGVAAVLDGRSDRIKSLALARVLENLIENAIKYSPAGGRVRIALVPGSERISARVSDTGVGIPEHEIPHIFERFTGSRNRVARGPKAPAWAWRLHTASLTHMAV